jgi:Rieske Fe-S protein
MVTPSGEHGSCRACLSRRGLIGSALAVGGAAIAAGAAPASALPARWRTVARRRQIEEGKGKVVTEGGVPLIVTRPRADVFRAFTAICTHQGCPVAGVRSRRITCDCHGSTFSIWTGAVLQGPAGRPLDRYRVRLRGARVQVLV